MKAPLFTLSAPALDVDELAAALPVAEVPLPVVLVGADAVPFDDEVPFEAVPLAANVTLNEFPARTVRPALLTTFTALKLVRVAANDFRVAILEASRPVVLRSSCV